MIAGLWCAKPYGCGKPAFFTDKLPVPGSLIESKDWIRADGGPIPPHSPICCPHCGVPITAVRERVYTFLTDRPQERWA